MIRYTRRTIRKYEPTDEPDAIALPMEDATFPQYFRYYLQSLFAWPWYGYILFGGVIGLCSLLFDFSSMLIGMGIVVLIYIGAALVAAHAFSKMAKNETYAGISDKGVCYMVEQVDDDGDGTHWVEVSGASWYEVNLVCVFRNFVMIKFVPTSELGVVIIPISNTELFKNDILSFWQRHSEEAPRGERDKRLLWVLIVIGLVVLRAVLKML